MREAVHTSPIGLWFDYSYLRKHRRRVLEALMGARCWKLFLDLKIPNPDNFS